MLKIVVPPGEFFSEITGEFFNTPQIELLLEHSLLSISKWESKWLKPFLDDKEKTKEENLDYIRCMTITQNVKPEIYLALSSENYKEISDYISSPMSATTFSAVSNKPGRKEIITSELIYCWMVQSNIPLDCEKWHINRLLTLIKICAIKNNPDKKTMSKNQIMSRNRALNEARKAKYKSRG